MAGALRKTMLYLGLADDSPAGGEYYDAPEAVPQAQPVPVPAPAPIQLAQAVVPAPEPEWTAEVTPIRRSVLPEAPVVAAAADLRRITTIHPRSYNDARLIGEAFRGGVPVILNLTDMDDADAKRLVDFSAGLIFGLHGGIERVTNKVFLLSPEHVEVLTEEDVEPSQGPGHFYNQS